MTIAKLPVFNKQRDLLFYPSRAYALPSWILRIPISFSNVFIWVGMTYYVISFDPNIQRMFRQYLLLLLIDQMTFGLFRVVGGVARDMVLADTYGSFVLLVVMALGGFIMSRTSVKKWWIWGYWSSPLTYAQNAIAVNEFLGHSWSKKQSPVVEKKQNQFSKVDKKVENEVESANLKCESDEDSEEEIVLKEDSGYGDEKKEKEKVDKEEKVKEHTESENVSNEKNIKGSQVKSRVQKIRFLMSSNPVKENTREKPIKDQEQERHFSRAWRGFNQRSNSTGCCTKSRDKMRTLDATRAELALLVLYLKKAKARDKICRAIHYGSKFVSNGEPGTVCIMFAVCVINCTCSLSMTCMLL